MLTSSVLFYIVFLGQSAVGDEPVGYEQAMKEISHNELIKGGGLRFDGAQPCNYTIL